MSIRFRSPPSTMLPNFFNFSSAFIPFLMAFDSNSGGSGASAYPPAPLRLASAEFGRVFEKESLQIFSPLSHVEPASSLRVYSLTSLTAVKAPLGLTQRLQHRWCQEGEFVCASPFHDIVVDATKGLDSGRAACFRASRRVQYSGSISKQKAGN